MVYLIRDTGTSQRLCEMSAGEARKAIEAPPEGVTYHRVEASTAHRWVRNDLIHETALWIDTTGRVRRATGDRK